MTGKDYAYIALGGTAAFLLYKWLNPKSVAKNVSAAASAIKTDVVEAYDNYAWNSGEYLFDSAQSGGWVSYTPLGWYLNWKAKQ